MGVEIAVNTKGGGRYSLSPKAAAVYACVSVSLVYRWCQDGSLPHLRVGGRGKRGKILISPNDLDALLDTFKVAGGQSVTAAASVPTSSGSPASPFSELNPQRLARAWKK